MYLIYSLIQTLKIISIVICYVQVVISFELLHIVGSNLFKYSETFSLEYVDVGQKFVNFFELVSSLIGKSNVFVENCGGYVVPVHDVELRVQELTSVAVGTELSRVILLANFGLEVRGKVHFLD